MRWAHAAWRCEGRARLSGLVGGGWDWVSITFMLKGCIDFLSSLMPLLVCTAARPSASSLMKAKKLERVPLLMFQYIHALSPSTSISYMAFCIICHFGCAEGECCFDSLAV